MSTRLIRQFSPSWAHRSANPFIYLACPYTSLDREVRQTRVEVASVVAAGLAVMGKAVYSPITHGHSMAQHLPTSLLADHNFWMGQCLPILAAADELWILPLQGWETSRGVAEEWAFATAHGIPVKMLNGLPAPWGNYLAGERPNKNCDGFCWHDASGEQPK
jgi:hypothetical protein